MSHTDWQPRLDALLRSRRFDEVLLDHAAHVKGAMPVSIGQEGTAAAAALARRPEDRLFLNHRNHHHLLANGADARRLYGEVFGRDVGFQRGRSGTLHLCEPDLGILHTSAMVGSAAGLAVGSGLAQKRLGRPGVTYAFFGDGALGEGLVSESFNLSVMWGLPMVFVCEANTTADVANPVQAAHRGSASSFTNIPAAYGVTPALTDGTDARAAQAAIAAASATARDGGGPQFVLSQTVPWPGNRGWFPTNLGATDLTHASAEVPDGWDRFDPVLVEVRALLRDGIDIDAILERDRAITAEMVAAIGEALDAALAPAEVAYDDVLAGSR